MRGYRRMLALVATSAALALTASACRPGTTGSPADSSPAHTAPAHTSSAEYQRAYDIGLQAYVYGLPLLVTDATFQTMTSVNVSQGAYGPVNQFHNVRSPNDSGSSAVVAPGATSLSSIAWVDLRAEPQVLHVPKVTGHYFVLALLDPYTENIANLGSASSTPPGDYVLDDGQRGSVALPSGTHRLAVDYSRIWIIGSTQLKGAGDIAAVNKIQDGYTLTPLSRYGSAYQPPAPDDPTTTVTRHEPPAGIAFFDQLGEQLAAFPPPAADAAAVSLFATVGIGQGRSPSTELEPESDTRHGLSDAAAAGADQVKQDTEALFESGFGKHNGYLLGGFGRYGTDYAERAAISQVGLGAFVAHQAIYAMTWTDGSKKALDGSSAYVLHLSNPPPTDEGWSLTVYTLKGALVAGAEGHNALTNISTLTRNPDGSIDLYLQPKSPESAARASNWLATPAGEQFEVTWRLFAPQAQAIASILDGTGWQPPAITTAS